MKPPVGAMRPDAVSRRRRHASAALPSRHTEEEQSLKEYYHAA